MTALLNHCCVWIPGECLELRNECRRRKNERKIDPKNRPNKENQSQSITPFALVGISHGSWTTIDLLQRPIGLLHSRESHRFRDITSWVGFHCQPLAATDLPIDIPRR